MPKNQSTAAKRARAAAREGAKYTTALREHAFAGAVVEIAWGFFRGPHWGGGLHSHITEMAVYARRADGSPLTADEALAPIESMRGLGAAELADALSNAFPGALVAEVYAREDDDDVDIEDQDDEDQGEPLLVYELTRTCDDDHDGVE